MADKRTSEENRNGRPQPLDLAKTAVQTITQMTGRRPESVLGLRKDDEGWKVTVEVLEMSRIPNSTDLLGSYVVSLDEDGQLLGYERSRRYQRGQGEGGDR